jgi:Tol biopolymer transport system component
MSPAEFASGRLLYTRTDDVLVAQEFDPGRFRLKGDPVPIAQNLLRVPTLFRTFFSVSQTGVLTYAAAGDAIHAPVQSVIVTDRKGNKLATVAESMQIDSLRFSPDGTRVLFDSRSGPGHDLWIYDLVRTLKTRLTFGEGKAFNAHGVWSVDGRRIAFLSFAPGKYSIHVKNADGSGSDEAVTDDDILPRWPGDWSPDQRHLALIAGTSFTVLPLTSFSNNRIEMLDLQGQKALPSSVPSIGSGEGKNFPRFSPDGKWLAYVSNESGQSQVMVTSLPGTTGRWQVSTDGGTSPAWRGDGKELFYIGPAPDNWVLSVEVAKNGDGLGFGKPQKLFQTLTPGGTLPFDVSRDGRSFAVVSSSSVSPPPIMLVTNWPAEVGK